MLSDNMQTDLVHAGPNEDDLLASIPNGWLEVGEDDAALSAGGVGPLLVRHSSPPVTLLTNLKVLSYMHKEIEQTKLTGKRE